MSEPKKIDTPEQGPINLDHIKKLTTDFGMLQFSKTDQPDPDSGYTLDDNARALIAMCHYVELTGDRDVTEYIGIYLRFIMYCQQPDGSFLNYVDKDKKFTPQNATTDLAEANGKAIWAIGYLISLENTLPIALTREAVSTMHRALTKMAKIHSTRAMAFVIKGLYYRNKTNSSAVGKSLMRQLANRLVQMYKHESDENWHWFENHLSYSNPILPEALLCAWLASSDPVYKQIAKTSFDFLLSRIFAEDGIKVISHKWIEKGSQETGMPAGSEQPIDVAYTIIALSKFYDVFKEPGYLEKMELAFDWFLGKNHLHKTIYDPSTGACYDALEENNVNPNQGAESTLAYLLSRLTLKRSLRNQKKLNGPNKNSITIPTGIAELPQNKN